MSELLDRYYPPAKPPLELQTENLLGRAIRAKAAALAAGEISLANFVDLADRTDLTPEQIRLKTIENRQAEHDRALEELALLTGRESSSYSDEVNTAVEELRNKYPVANRN